MLDRLKKRPIVTGAVIVISMVCLLIIILGLMVPDEQVARAEPTMTPTHKAPTDTPSLTLNTRCQPASAQQIEAVLDGIQDLDPDNTIGKAYSVKSNDFSGDVYFVAAMLYGPGMEKGTGPGLWAMGGSPASPGPILAVDGFAQQFSDWPYVGDTTLDVDQFDDGAQIAKECAALSPE